LQLSTPSSVELSIPTPDVPEASYESHTLAKDPADLAPRVLSPPATVLFPATSASVTTTPTTVAHSSTSTAIKPSVPAKAPAKSAQPRNTKSPKLVRTGKAVTAPSATKSAQPTLKPIVSSKGHYETSTVPTPAAVVVPQPPVSMSPIMVASAALSPPIMPTASVPPPSPVPTFPPAPPSSPVTPPSAVNVPARRSKTVKGTSVHRLALSMMPDWLKKSIKILERVSSGPEWNDLLRAFTDHERATGYPVGVCICLISLIPTLRQYITGYVGPVLGERP
jgi:hypothetical protein